jgi:hypothetical protein
MGRLNIVGINFGPNPAILPKIIKHIPVGLQPSPAQERAK